MNIKNKCYHILEVKSQKHLYGLYEIRIRHFLNFTLFISNIVCETAIHILARLTSKMSTLSINFHLEWRENHQSTLASALYRRT